MSAIDTPAGAQHPLARLRMFVLATCAFALAGCATSAGYERLLNAWVGQPEIALLRKWGTPVASFQSGSTSFLTFSSDRTVLVPGTAPTHTSTQVGSTVQTKSTGGSPPYHITLRCVTTFEVTDGRVVNWRYDGNDCKAHER